MTRKNKISTIAYQVIFWSVAVILYVIFRYLGIDEQVELFTVNEQNFSFGFTLLASIATGAILGLILGIVDIFLMRLNFKKMGFGKLVIFKALLYIGIFVSLIYISMFCSSLAFGYGVGEAFKIAGRTLFSRFMLSMVIFGMVVSFLASFVKQMNRKLGSGVLMRLMMGKYHQPQVENRLFMFIDLKSSTTHAEKLGNIRYSQLIQDVFYDLNQLVDTYQAEIYQYVGDEAVLTWHTDKCLNNINFIRLFYDFRQLIDHRAEYYEKEYQIVPEFKAGVNVGQVTVAEVGEIKSEIAYHGDVLNTAARIQGECNKLGACLLVSENVAEQFPINGEFEKTYIASLLLRGKQSEVGVYSVNCKKEK